MIRTWMVELAVVAIVMSAVTIAGGNEPLEWLGSAAVLAAFAHGQVADRLAAAEARRNSPDVDCHRWGSRYWFAKEALFAAYFVGHESWAALGGVAVFLVYPVWRTAWRACASRGHK